MTVLATLNTEAFQWLAAGNTPNAAVLLVARAFALWGAWLAAAVLCWAAWRRPADWAYLCMVAAAAGIASLLSHSISASLNVPRPFMVGLSPSYIGHGGSGSLPSTHATVMFAIALALLRRPSLRVAGLWLVAVAAITGWGRVYVGVHYPLDIVVGLLLAMLVTAALALGQWLLQEDWRRNGVAASPIPWRRS